MWARVKGKTENDLAKLPFKQSFGFRIGMVKPVKGQKHVLKYYKYFSWLVPILQRLTPGIVSTMREVSNAMIYVAKYGFERSIITVKDIRWMSGQIDLLKNREE